MRLLLFHEEGVVGSCERYGVHPRLDSSASLKVKQDDALL